MEKLLKKSKSIELNDTQDVDKLLFEIHKI